MVIQVTMIIIHQVASRYHLVLAIVTGTILSTVLITIATTVHTDTVAGVIMIHIIITHTTIAMFTMVEDIIITDQGIITTITIMVTILILAIMPMVISRFTVQEIQDHLYHTMLMKSTGILIDAKIMLNQDQVEE